MLETAMNRRVRPRSSDRVLRRTPEVGPSCGFVPVQRLSGGFPPSLADDGACAQGGCDEGLGFGRCDM
jgi:hypothetical protein